MPPTLSRRATLALVGAVAGGPLAACSLRPTPPAPGAAPVAPDQPALTRLVRQIRALARHSPEPWHGAHVAQLAALGSTRPVTRASGTLDLRAERALHASLVDAAVGAHDAGLVRLLSSLAAGQAQLLARG